MDADVKYGLSVTGVVHPDHIYGNNQGQPSDMLILTKNLGVGLVCNANRVNLAPEGCYEGSNRFYDSPEQKSSGNQSSL